jgi:hypothetical protein
MGVKVSVGGGGVTVKVEVGRGVTVRVGVGNPPESARPTCGVNHPRRDRASRRAQVSSSRRPGLTVEKSREVFFIFSILFPRVPIPAFIVPLIEQLCYPAVSLGALQFIGEL